MGKFKQFYIESQDIEDEDDVYSTYTDLEDEYEDDDSVEEGNKRLFRRIVIRNGKKKKKWSTEIPNHKVIPDPDGGRPTVTKMKPDEIRRKRKGQKMGAIKRKSKKAQILIKRRISNLKRKVFGVKRRK